MQWDLIRSLCCNLCLFCRKASHKDPSQHAVYTLSTCYAEEKKMYTRSRTTTVHKETVKLGHISRSRKGFNGVEKMRERRFRRHK